MLDLVHASRGCRFNCFPCCSAFLGGKTFRPRPIDHVIEEMETIRNNRLFIVDNSLAQDRQWLIDLFTAMAPLKKKWVSHPILDDDRILKLAADAGAWYVYQAVFDTSDLIRNRIRRLKEHGIAVEGTILLGTDEQDEDSIRRLVDFLLEVELDVAEFTIMTPFPHSPLRTRLAAENRLLSSDWGEYTADQVVFRPRSDVPGEAPGDVPLRLGHVLCGRRPPDQDGQAFREGDPAGDGGRHLLPLQSPSGKVLPETGESPVKRILLVSSNISREPLQVYPLGLAIVAAALAASGTRWSSSIFWPRANRRRFSGRRSPPSPPTTSASPSGTWTTATPLPGTGYPEIAKRLVGWIRETVGRRSSSAAPGFPSFRRNCSPSPAPTTGSSARGNGSSAS